MKSILTIGVGLCQTFFSKQLILGNPLGIENSILFRMERVHLGIIKQRVKQPFDLPLRGSFIMKVT